MMFWKCAIYLHNGKQRLSFVLHFIILFNTTMPMPGIVVHSEAPMSQFLNRRFGMGCKEF